MTNIASVVHRMKGLLGKKRKNQRAIVRSPLFRIERAGEKLSAFVV